MVILFQSLSNKKKICVMHDNLDKEAKERIFLYVHAFF
jgi:hypothetical protein